MAYLIGILLDVSGSMRHHIGGVTDEEGGPWARSIFEVIDNLIKYDISSDNHVFAVGVGACTGEGIFDIIGTLKRIQYKDEKTEGDVERPATSTQINRIFRILERSGARTVSKWAAEEVVIRALKYREADLLLNKFKSDTSFRKTFVQEILPPACRDWSQSTLVKVTGLSPFTDAVQGAFASVASSFVRAKVADIREVFNQAEPYLLKEDKEKECLLGVTVNSIFKVKDALNVLHGCIGEKGLSKEKSRELLQSVEPYIYGGTPLYQSIEKTIELFQASTFSSHKKLLFILSGGEPTDGEATCADGARIDRVVSKLTTAGVTVVSCFVSHSTQIEPRRLFSKMGPDWDWGAKFLFSLSSKVSTQSLPHTIFVKRGWTIDHTNNETHLFLQLNHPDNLREIREVARNVVCCQDALSDLLASVDLDLHINQEVRDYKAKRKQEGETVHADVAATVFHLSIRRILGRVGGYPNFYELREEIVKEFDPENYPFGVPTIRVLQKMCPKYRLQCKRVDLKGAMQAVTLSRPVVATFRLTDNEWDSFDDFYESNPKGILTKREIDITAHPPKTPDFGHAVVLTSFDSECLRLLNSWGEEWADMGFFRVENADVLGLNFIDVYWTEEDLKEEEIIYFKKHGSTVARQLMELLPSLKRAEYTCPKCRNRSPIMEFAGTLSRAKCPKCGKEIYTENAQEGNILALNIFLTSLIR